MSAALCDPAIFFQALARHRPGDMIVVDFDETLWLRNSTEMFLDSVRPRFLAAMMLQLLGVLRPWRLFSRPEAHRDWIRVVAVLLVAPWSLARWRRQAATLGPRLVNRPLFDALRSRPAGEIAVVTLGFREIVGPLLAAIDTRLPLLESCSLRSGARLRIEGKARALERRFGRDRLQRALSVSDSLADRELLERSGRGFLVEWPGALYQQAGLRPLMPFVYLQRVKRPDENYIRHAILGHDLPVLLLAFALISAAPLAAVVSLLLFMTAFFTAYEIGYHENDRLGLKLEAKPKVSAQYHLLGPNFDARFAWGVAALLGSVASVVAVPASWLPGALGVGGLGAAAVVCVAFLLLLLAIRLIFRWQNVVEPKGRIVPMLGLQVGRVLGYAIIFPTSVVGALFCVAHGLSRWLPYVVYRFGGSRKDVPNHLNALMLLVLFAGAVAIGGGPGALLTWQAALILLYASLRAGKDLLTFRANLRPIARKDRDGGDHPAEVRSCEDTGPDDVSANTHLSRSVPAARR